MMSINTDHSIAAALNMEESFRGTSKCESEDGQANTIMSEGNVRLQGFNKDGVAVARGRLATVFAQGKMPELWLMKSPKQSQTKVGEIVGFNMCI